LHARIVGAIERGYPGRLSEHVERLAHHAVRGELWEQAVAYLRQSGVKALAHSGSREAAGAFEQALVALAHLPEVRATVEQGIDLRFELRQALQALGEHQRVVDYLYEAETLAATLDDQRRLGRVTGYLGQYFALLGETERAAEAGQRTLTIGDATGDFGLQVSSHSRLGQLAYWTGDYQRAKPHLLWIVDALTEDRVRERFGQSGMPAQRDPPEHAEGHYRDALALAEELEMRPLVAHCHLGLSKLRHRTGDPGQAQEHLTIATAMYREMGMTYWPEQAEAELRQLG
jgi:tetratricopeptide (TPR) repeat protein